MEFFRSPKWFLGSSSIWPEDGILQLLFQTSQKLYIYLYIYYNYNYIHIINFKAHKILNSFFHLNIYIYIIILNIYNPNNRDINMLKLNMCFFFTTVQTIPQTRSSHVWSDSGRISEPPKDEGNHVFLYTSCVPNIGVEKRCG